MLNKKIDLSKKAKPTGYRFKGTHNELKSKYYKRPERVLSEKQLHNQLKKGLVYYEPRLTKGDIRQDSKFARGGVVNFGWLWSWLNQKF